MRGVIATLAASLLVGCAYPTIEADVKGTVAGDAHVKAGDPFGKPTYPKPPSLVHKECTVKPDGTTHCENGVCEVPK